jgi:hypothetical protein
VIHTPQTADNNQIRWHVPSPEEINLAVVILEEVVQPYMTELDAVLHKPSLDHDEKCNFVKLCTMAKFVVAGISAFVVMGSPDDPGDPCTHWGSVFLIIYFGD